MAVVSKGEEVTEDFQAFLANIRKYTNITELISAVLNEFTPQTEIHAPEKVNGKQYAALRKNMFVHKDA